MSLTCARAASYPAGNAQRQSLHGLGIDGRQLNKVFSVLLLSWLGVVWTQPLGPNRALVYLLFWHCVVNGFKEGGFFEQEHPTVLLPKLCPALLKLHMHESLRLHSPNSVDSSLYLKRK